MFNRRYFRVGHKEEWPNELMIVKGVKQWYGNVLYRVGQYYYFTDGTKRVVDARGFLSLTKVDRHPYQQKLVGKLYRPTGDDGGHLFASRFGGSGLAINMIPQNSYYNQRGPWRQLELKWTKLLKEGHQVYVVIQPMYLGNCMRPYEFRVWYVIDEFPDYDTQGDTLTIDNPL